MAKVAFIVVFEHVVFSLKALIQHIIPDVPKEVQIAIQRQQYLEKQELELTIKHARHYEREHSLTIAQTGASSIEEVSIPIPADNLATVPEFVEETSIDMVHSLQEKSQPSISERAFTPTSHKSLAPRQVSKISLTGAPDGHDDVKAEEPTEAKLEVDTSEA